MANAGLGPAKLKWFMVFVDGKPQSDWRAMFKSHDFERIPEYLFIIPGYVGWHGKDVSNWILKVETGPAYAELKKKSDRIDFKYCYCSVYNDCWVSKTMRKDKLISNLRVDECGNPPGEVLTTPTDK